MFVPPSALSQTRPDVGPPQSESVTQPHSPPGRQMPIPAQFELSDGVHSTHVSDVVSQTSGDGQSLSMTQSPYTVDVVLLAWLKLLRPTSHAAVAVFW